MPILPALALCAAAASSLASPSAAASPAASARASAVRAWEGNLDLPTHEEGLPDVNPPFDAFETGRFNYPYTLRHTSRKSEPPPAGAPSTWRTST
jgi:hypothetical protein